MKDKDKEFEYPTSENDPAHNEWLERRIEKFIDGEDEEKKGSFGKMAEVERNLKKKKG